MVAHTPGIGGDSALAINVGAVLDPDDSHNAFLGHDPVDDPVGATSRHVIPLELSLKGLTDEAWSLEQRTEEKLDDRGGNLGREPGKYSFGCGRNLESPRAHRCRYFARSSSAVTTLPESRSASALRIARIAFGSDRIESVSSSASKSSGLMSTAAGRPLRVSTTRSCSCSTRSTISDR